MARVLFLNSPLLLLAILLVNHTRGRSDDQKIHNGDHGRNATRAADDAYSEQFQSKQNWWSRLGKSVKPLATKARLSAKHQTRLDGFQTSSFTRKDQSTSRPDGRGKMQLEGTTKPPKCGDYVEMGTKRRWTHRETQTRTAYLMALMSTLAYWDFHKPRTLNATGFRLQPGRIRGIQLHLCRIRRRIGSIRRKIKEKLTKLAWSVVRRSPNTNFTHLTQTSCLQTTRKRSKSQCDASYTFDYWLYNWFEPTSVPRVNYHDTDLLVSTSADNKVLVLAFAGTQSAADHVTNVQTFEPASHSGLFNSGTKNITIEGSIHRGFLNAYSRVERGSVLRLCQNCSTKEATGPLSSLYKRYGSCTRVNEKQKRTTRAQSAASNGNKTTGDSSSTKVEQELGAENHNGFESAANDAVTMGKNGGCHTRGVKLMTILTELVTDSLRSGRTVHLAGHSQGGSLATLLALDILINFPDVPVSLLQVWTFGAPQVADDLFLESATVAAPRLRQFVHNNGNGRFHRFVTLSDDCQVDFVSTVTERALPAHQQNIRGKAARKLGGVRGNVVHLAKPHYLLTPEQFNSSNTDVDDNMLQHKTATRSTLAAHSMINYLQGISRESSDHPLSSDLPPESRSWIGESQSN